MSEGLSPIYTRGGNTCVRGLGSKIDLLITSTNLCYNVKSSEVLDEFTGSDHLYLLHDIEMEQPENKRMVNIKKKHKQVNTKRNNNENMNDINTDKYIEIFLKKFGNNNNDRLTMGQSINNIKNIMNEIQAIGNKCKKRKCSRPGRYPVYWWNSEISNQRKITNGLWRKVTRARKNQNSSIIEIMEREYKTAKRELNRKIRNSKKESFEKLINMIDNDIWGKPYKMVIKQIKPNIPPVKLDIVQMRKIIEGLFVLKPEDSGEYEMTITGKEIKGKLDSYLIRDANNTEADRIITEEEIIKACNKIAIKKAPGPDGIPAIAAKKIGLGSTIFWKKLLNLCMELGYWPVEWKMTRLVLLPKMKIGPKESDKFAELKPSDFRPLCISSNMAKIFEQIIKNRLLEAIKVDNLSPYQFGFRRGYSTTHAMDKVIQLWDKAKKEARHCLLILLDVKNAFNSLRWNSVIREMIRRKFPRKLVNLIRSYLSERWLIINSNGISEKVQVHGGVPQGSIIGPFMWNLVYDGLLKIKLRRDVYLVAFADDIGVIIIEKDLEKMSDIANDTLRDMNKWYNSEGLELAPHKSESLLLTGRKHPRGIQVSIGNDHIPIRRKAKYLGVIFEDNQVFKQHINAATEKASNYAMHLSLLMPNTKGAGMKARQLYYNVVNSVVTYGAPIWARALTYKVNIKTLRDAQRLPLSRICKAYRTVSTEVLCIVTGKLPRDHKIKEIESIFRSIKKLKNEGIPFVTIENNIKEETHKIKEKEHNKTMQGWQEEWTNLKKGRWTHKIIPIIDEWYQGGFPPLDYYTVQALTGHGCFGTYLHKIGKESTPNCWFCENQNDDVEHTIFHCPRWSLDRSLLEMNIFPKKWEVKNFAYLLKKRTTNIYVRNFCRACLSEKEKWEKLYREKMRKETRKINTIHTN